MYPILCRLEISFVSSEELNDICAFFSENFTGAYRDLFLIWHLPMVQERVFLWLTKSWRYSKRYNLTKFLTHKFLIPQKVGIGRLETPAFDLTKIGIFKPALDLLGTLSIQSGGGDVIISIVRFFAAIATADSYARECGGRWCVCVCLCMFTAVYMQK